MSSHRFYGSLIILGLVAGCHMVWASDTISTTAAKANANSEASSPAASVPALPANLDTGVKDGSSSRKFYTLTASIREVYDDNVNTVKDNPQTSYETEISPSILVDFPSVNGDFSARYTFQATYYSVLPTNSSADTQNSSGFEYTHEFVALFTHTFSERFSINLAEQFRNYTEPSLYESVGTPYRNGAYTSNNFNGTLTSQWTPLFGTTTNYTNTIIRYDNNAVAIDQDSTENVGSQTFSFTLLPRVSANFGGFIDDVAYKSDLRGFTSYTGFVGGLWQVQPSLSVNGRLGGSYIENVKGPADTTPYVSFSLNWVLGARSQLTFDYAHQVTPTDQVGANGQTSDRFTSNFKYDITPRLSSHLLGSFTHADITQQFTNSGLSSGYKEDYYYVDAGLTFHYNNYLDLNGGVTLSGVNTDNNFTNYTRDELYLGLRGTY